MLAFVESPLSSISSFSCVLALMPSLCVTNENNSVIGGNNLDLTHSLQLKYSESPVY